MNVSSIIPTYWAGKTNSKPKCEWTRLFSKRTEHKLHMCVYDEWRRGKRGNWLLEYQPINSKIYLYKIISRRIKLN